MADEPIIVIPDSVIRSLGVAFCLAFLLGYYCTWQSNILDDFSPTGYLKDLSNPSDIWVCLAINVFAFVGVNLTALIMCYRVIKYGERNE